MLIEPGPALAIEASAPDKERFLIKNPFEEPFFGYDSLRMMRLTPKRVSYANGLTDTCKDEL